MPEETHDRFGNAVGRLTDEVGLVQHNFERLRMRLRSHTTIVHRDCHAGRSRPICSMEIALFERGSVECLVELRKRLQLNWKRALSDNSFSFEQWAIGADVPFEVPGPRNNPHLDDSECLRHHGKRSC